MRKSYLFDALNQSKVDSDTIQLLFERRNIVASKKTSRSSLAKYFSRLTHDFLDHEDIALKLGILTRRERITSLDLETELDRDQVSRALENFTNSLKEDGDVVQVSKNGTSIILEIQYSEINYQRSEFSQVQNKYGQIEIVKNSDGFIIRSTQSEYINNARDELLKQLQTETIIPIKKSNVSLYEHRSSNVRSKFFYDLMKDLPGYARGDVTDVYVYKAKAELTSHEEDESSSDTHVEKVFMRGNRVNQSKLLNDLLTESKYHISRVGWIGIEKLGKGNGFEIEAMFNDPKDCTGFSYLLRGVYVLEDNGKLSKKRRPPTRDEIDHVSRAIEEKSRELVKLIKDQESTDLTEKS